MQQIWNDLIDAIDNKNIEDVRTLIKKGGKKLFNKEYTLIRGVLSGDYNIIKLLINEGANINVFVGGMSPLTCACKHGYAHIMELLFQEGATLDDYADFYSLSLIYFCLNNDNIESLKLLIQHGFDFDGFLSNSIVQSLKCQKKNILEFIINNYPDAVKNHEITIKQKNIKKYLFIKMLIDREVIDVSN